MFRATLTALALSAVLTAGTAHALTWETPKGENIPNGQAQVADPDNKIQQQMGVTNATGPKAPGAPNTYKLGNGFSFGISGGPGGNPRDDQSNALRFGPQTPSDQRPTNSRLNSVFGWQ